MVCSLFRKQIISKILSLWSFLRLIFNIDVYRDDRRDDVFASIITFEKGTSNDERFITIKNSRESHKWATLHETRYVASNARQAAVSITLYLSDSLEQLWQIIIIQMYSRIYEAFKSEMRSKHWSSRKQTLKLFLSSIAFSSNKKRICVCHP